MDFGKALEALKAGDQVARPGWNGKGMSVELLRDATTSDGREVAPFLALHAADGSLVAWVTSQADVLAEDWEVA